MVWCSLCLPVFKARMSVVVLLNFQLGVLEFCMGFVFESFRTLICVGIGVCALVLEDCRCLRTERIVFGERWCLVVFESVSVDA